MTHASGERCMKRPSPLYDITPALESSYNSAHPQSNHKKQNCPRLIPRACSMGGRPKKGHQSPDPKSTQSGYEKHKTQ